MVPRTPRLAPRAQRGRPNAAEETQRPETDARTHAREQLARHHAALTTARAHRASTAPLRPGRKLFTEGDRVELLVGQAYQEIHPDVADELEDGMVRVRVPAGTTGEVVAVRQYVSPFPYIVQVRDGRGVTVEISVAEHDFGRSTV